MSTIKIEPADNLDLSRLLHVFKFLNEARATSITVGEPVSVELNNEEYEISYNTDTQQLAEEIQSLYNNK
mgnify:FL=1